MDHCSIVTMLITADRHTAAAVAAHMCVDHSRRRRLVAAAALLAE
jgi:hypothetical protein